MKITHVIWDLNIGGTQSYLKALLKYQCRNEAISLSLIVLKNKGALSNDVERYVDQVNYIGMRNGFDIFSGVRLLYYIFSHNPSLLHAHTCNILTQLMLFLCGKPYVYTEHGAGVDKDVNRGRITYKYFRKRISRFFAVSEYMKLRMLELDDRNKDKIITVYNGIDVEKIKAIQPTSEFDMLVELKKYKYIIGTVGRLAEVKRIDLFINTAKEIVKNRDDVCFVIVGDGEQREYLEKIVVESKLTKEVFFLGFRTDSVSVLKSFDLYLSTSMFESFGLAIVEAMASNVPVVSVDICALHEIIENKKEGVLVPSEKPYVIANEVVELLMSDALMKKYTANAINKVTKKFDIKITAKILIEQYKLILNSQ